MIIRIEPLAAALTPPLADATVVLADGIALPFSADVLKVVMAHDQDVTIRIDYRQHPEDSFTTGPSVALSASGTPVVQTAKFTVGQWRQLRILAVNGSTNQGASWRPVIVGRPRNEDDTGVLAENPAVLGGTVSWAYPGSDVYPAEMRYARQGMVGGVLARSWVALTVGSTDFVIDIGHNGSSANPTDHVPALAGYTRVAVDLGSSTNTPAQVAAAVIAACAIAGFTVTTNGTDSEGRAIVVAENASNLIIPDPVDTRDTTLRGMWGMQRNSFLGSAANSNGGNSDAAIQHMGTPGAALGRTGRVIGVYGWGHTGWTPRIGVFTGPTFSTDPGDLTLVGQSAMPTIDALGFTMAPVDADAAAFSSSANVWVACRQGSTGGIRFRGFGAGTGRGNMPAAQRSIQDTTTSSDPSVAFPSTYSVTHDNDFGIWLCLGMVFELQDSNGNYPADGAIDFNYGDHNTDPEHNSPTLVGSATTNGETTHHTYDICQMTGIRTTESGRGISDVASDEDSKMVWYDWLGDPGFPPAGAPQLLGGNELLGFGAFAGGSFPVFVNHVLATPVDLGIDTVGANAILSVGHNFVTTDGSATSDLVIPVWLANGSGGFIGSLWLGDDDERATWHDDDPEANEGAYAPGTSEHRTREADGALLMPYDSTSEDFPQDFDTTNNDSPNAVANDRQRIQKPGVVAVAA